MTYCLLLQRVGGRENHAVNSSADQLEYCSGFAEARLLMKQNGLLGLNGIGNLLLNAAKAVFCLLLDIWTVCHPLAHAGNCSRPLHLAAMAEGLQG